MEWYKIMFLMFFLAFLSYGAIMTYWREKYKPLYDIKKFLTSAIFIEALKKLMDEVEWKAALHDVRDKFK